MLHFVVLSNAVRIGLRSKVKVELEVIHLLTDKQESTLSSLILQLLFCSLKILKILKCAEGEEKT